MTEEKPKVERPGDHPPDPAPVSVVEPSDRDSRWWAVLFRPRWEALLDRFDSSVVRSAKLWFVLVPLSVAAIRRAESVRLPWVLDGDGDPFAVHLSLPFSWLVLFGGSCSFVVGEVLLMLCCNPALRRFRSLQAFVEAPDLAELTRAAGNRQELRERLAKTALDVTDSATPIMSNLPRQTASPNLLGTLLLAEHWRAFADGMNEGGHFIRGACAVLFLVGALCYATVSTQAIASVVAFVFSE